MKNVITLILLFVTSLSYGQWGYHGQTPTNQGLSIATGNMPGMTTVYKFGRNEAVGVTDEVIWDGGSDYTWITEPDYIEVVSSSTDDTDGGDGAWVLYVSGLDSSGYEQTEEFTLNGTTQVTSNNKFYRVFRAYVSTSGSNTSFGNNVGTITIRKATGDTTLAQILPLHGQTLMAVYTVPKGKTGYICGFSISAGQGKSVLFKSYYRNGTGEHSSFSLKDVHELYQNSTSCIFAVPIRLTELTDLFMSAKNLQSGTVACSASFELILIDN